MKRAARFFVILQLPLLLLIPPVPPAAFTDAADAAGLRVRAWIDDLRAQRGLLPLAADPLLEQTAAAYASDLSDRGVLSHVDEQGRRALQRYQARGGTTVLVGEILGSGAALPSVTAAWEASPRHLEIVLNPLWTHCGVACARSGSTEVWVLLFTSHRIHPLQILPSARGYLIRGRLASVRALEPVLLSGIEPIDPLRWDSASGEFDFFISSQRGQIYHRLGYRSTDGAVVVTNTFYPLRVLRSGAVRPPPSDPIP
jgi:hypothetical protein